MPPAASDRASASRLNCGWRRDTGNARTSIRCSTACARSISRKCSIGRVEWPMVRIALTSIDSGPDVSQRVMREQLAAVRDALGSAVDDPLAELEHSRRAEKLLAGGAEEIGLHF